MKLLSRLVVVAACAQLTTGCDSETDAEAKPRLVEGPCQIDAGDGAPDSLARIACKRDFEAMASAPLDDSIPGARSVKLVLDQAGGDALYFQNSEKYEIHYQFAFAHLSGGDLPLVSTREEFDATEYFDPDRRFLLGAVTYYEEPDAWVLEIAPYDTASPEMIDKLFDRVAAASFFGPALAFHPGSAELEHVAADLPADLPVLTTADLYADIDYQPLNLGETVGKLRFLTVDELATTYVGFRDLVVLDRVPNDISVVSGLITQEFQTPLAHVNVLAQNRGTPNMGLRGAMKNRTLRALDGEWVKLVVGAFDWSAEEVSQAHADEFWEAHKPAPVTLPALDLTVRDLRDLTEVTEQAPGEKVTREAIKQAVTAFGAKAANYSVLMHTEGVPIRKAFAIPAYYYVQFMEQNGFTERVRALLADESFKGDAAVRDAALKSLRDEMKLAPFDPGLSALLKEKLAQDFPGETMRFRTSTNAEDLDGFPCAGCYDSHTGDPADWEGSLLTAVRKTWATVWKYRTFEERSYHSIDHLGVGMALLVHHNFPAEEANGVAITANPFDPKGLSPGYYVNVQFGGDAEVVAPPPGVTSDSFIYHYGYQGTPTQYLTHSNLIDEGATVLTRTQVHDLGLALTAIHDAFTDAYGPGAGNTGWYAMDVEFKLDDEAAPTEAPALYIKQARPYPGRGN